MAARLVSGLATTKEGEQVPHRGDGLYGRAASHENARITTVSFFITIFEFKIKDRYCKFRMSGTE
jgi:hypothetical protein